MSHNYEAMAAEIDRRLNDPSRPPMDLRTEPYSAAELRTPSRASARCPLIPRIGCSTFLRMSIAGGARAHAGD